MPSIRASLKAKKIPSEDGNIIEPIDISSHYNLSKNSKIFNIDLSNITSGEVQKGTKLFNLFNKSTTSANCVIAVGSEGKEKNARPNKMERISMKEDVSSCRVLQSRALSA